MINPTLLAVATIAPWPVRDGYSLRIFHLLRELATHWAITLVAPAGEEAGLAGVIAEYYAVALRGPGLSYPWRFDTAPLRDAVDGIEGMQAALVWPGAETLWTGRDRPPAVADIIDCNPLEFWRAFAADRGLRNRARHLRECLVSIGVARRMLGDFTATVCVGEDDAAWLRALGGGGRVHVVPNGVALPEEGAEDLTPALGFVGSLDFPPNIDAALYAARAIWPLIAAQMPQARFIIAGRNPVSELRALDHERGISVLPDVPDMAPVLAQCWVTIAPMRIGAGIKNKVLESWAASRPVVMSRLATNGLSLPAGHADFVTDDAMSMAAEVLRLFGDDEARHAAGAAARAHVRDRFTWAGAARQIDALLRAAAGLTQGHQS